MFEFIFIYLSGLWLKSYTGILNSIDKQLQKIYVYYKFNSGVNASVFN